MMGFEWDVDLKGKNAKDNVDLALTNGDDLNCDFQISCLLK